MNYNPVTDSDQDYRSVLEVAESEPRTDGGWTTIKRKFKRTETTDKLLNIGKPGMDNMRRKSVMLYNMNEYKLSRIGDNNMSDLGRDLRSDLFARNEKG
jgi:hypothetical protein